MLRKAKQRVDRAQLKNVEGLAVMDAEKLEFPDNSFDVVMAQYVVTAVPNPEVALDEFARVLRPGGDDHPVPGSAPMPACAASSSSGCSRWCVRSVSGPPSSPGRAIAQWLAGAHGMELVERRLVPPLGHFSLVRFRKVEIAGGRLRRSARRHQRPVA